jgi:hypothetical protein
MGGLPGATRERRPNMRTAILEVSGKISKQSVRVELRYYYLSSNRWSCPPGYLRASKGYWKSSGNVDTLYLYDDNDKLVASGINMDVQHFGYPFDGLKGDTGPFWVNYGGALDQDVVTWRFIDV